MIMSKISLQLKLEKVQAGIIRKQEEIKVLKETEKQLKISLNAEKKLKK